MVRVRRSLLAQLSNPVVNLLELLPRLFGPAADRLQLFDLAFNLL
jgi:hypothetical protein